MCSEDSKFYDPFLKKTLDRIVKNLFNEFLDLLESLGAKIIYASPYKLFLKTNRRSYYSANAFVQFVIESLL